MKTVSIAQASAQLPELLRLVEGGEEVKLVRRKKGVAKIIPLKPIRKNGGWPGHFAKLDKIFRGKPAPGKPGSRIVIEGRR
jgi:antitoxin (DNA-binding transcriptional repressor) of toxin-antitoxin stability system